jgi:stearoyl-CoA desaturase (Delta-9 desaturase)
MTVSFFQQRDFIGSPLRRKVFALALPRTAFPQGLNLEISMSTAAQPAKQYRFVVYRGKHGTMTAKLGFFILLQLSFLLAFTTYFSWTGVLVCLASYVLRMFAITGFFHRYFSHRTFKMGRAMQFFAAFLGTTATQKGPLWWASHHRQHHKTSDTPDDPHNSHEGFLHSHWLWFLYRESDVVHYDSIRDLTRFPELAFLTKYYYLPPLLYGIGLYLIGGWHWTVWGYFVSTVLLSNGTYTINSLMHYYGWQNYSTGDNSRNHWIFALITLGEGWHNNHHRYQASARNGFYWYEFDITYYILRVLSFFGLISDLNPVPEKLLEEGRANCQLRKAARATGAQYAPERLLRDEIQSLGDPVGARAFLLRREVQSLNAQMAERRRHLGEEVQTLGEYVEGKRRELNAEIQQLGVQVADKAEKLKIDVDNLSQHLNQVGKELGGEINELGEQVSERWGHLRQEIQTLSEQATRKGKDLKVDMEELSDFMASTFKELGAEIEALGEQLGTRARQMMAELDELNGLLPQRA